MKKFTFNCDAIHGNGCGLCIEGTREWGDTYDAKWVKAEEAEALEQLNKEMLEVLKEALDYVGAEGGRLHPTHHTKLMSQLQSIIAKAEEV